MYHNPFFFALSLSPIKLMYVPLPIPFLPLTHAVTNVRYSTGMNYKHHKRYILCVVNMYRKVIILVNFPVSHLSITCRLPSLDTHASDPI